MRKILNPFRGLAGYECFGCCPDNQLGLQMSFYEEGNYIYSEWDPKAHFQGYIKVLHGGIQSTLIDEIASWACYVKLETAGVTSRINIKYKLPVYIDQGKILLKAIIDSVHRNIAKIKVELLNSNRQLCAEGLVDYYMLPKEKAEKEFNYPGIEKFFTN